MRRRGQPRGFLQIKSNDISAPVGTRSEALSQKARCAAFHRCLSAAFPCDAARLRGVVRVLREWFLARSAPASPLARACALHLLCRGACFASDARVLLASLGVLLGGAAACSCVRSRALPIFGQLHSSKCTLVSYVCYIVVQVGVAAIHILHAYSV